MLRFPYVMIAGMKVWQLSVPAITIPPVSQRMSSLLATGRMWARFPPGGPFSHVSVGPDLQSRETGLESPPLHHPYLYGTRYTVEVNSLEEENDGEFYKSGYDKTFEGVGG